MKKLIPLILIVFVFGCGRDLRSDKMRREQMEPWNKIFGGMTGSRGFGGANFGSFDIGSINVPACNMSGGSFQP